VAGVPAGVAESFVVGSAVGRLVIPPSVVAGLPTSGHAGSTASPPPARHAEGAGRFGLAPDLIADGAGAGAVAEVVSEAVAGAGAEGVSETTSTVVGASGSSQAAVASTVSPSNAVLTRLRTKWRI
jgi:hypothetical protein